MIASTFFCLDFLLPELVSEEKLPVEIRFVHDVEIHYGEMLYSRTDEMHRAIGAKPAYARNPDARRFERSALLGRKICVCSHLSLQPSA